MRVIELLTQVRNVLQDTDKIHWTDSELLNHYNDCRRQIDSERLEENTSATLTLTEDKNVYDTTGVLRYISAKDYEGNERPLYSDDGSVGDDDMGIVVEAYNRINVVSPDIGTGIVLKVIAYPSEQNLDSNVRIGDENALKNYIMSKAYEQETDMENFQKSGYFYNKYKEYLGKLISSSSSNYKAKVVETTQAYYY